MIVTLVVAMDEGDLIGKDGGLPWRLPADLAHFKVCTMGKPIVMGRKTWQSIGRPLPGRENVVLTRDQDFRAPGALVFHDPDAILRHFAAVEEVCIIGGAEIYRLFLPRATRLEMTRVHDRFAGDTRFPALIAEDWRETARLRREADDKNSSPMSFITLERRT